MFCCFSLYRPIQKENQAVGQNRARICAYRVVHTIYLYNWHKHHIAAWGDQVTSSILQTN